MSLASQTTQQTAAVVDFSTVANANPPRPAKSTSVHPDAALIEACIECAALVAGARAGYLVDPTDAEFSSPRDQRANRRADKAIETILGNPPKTIDGVRAKADLLAVVMEDWWDFPMDQLRKKLVLSLIADVDNVQRAARELKTSNVVMSVPK